MDKKTDLDVWMLAATVKRMDAEIGAIWKFLRGELRPQDSRQVPLFPSEKAQETVKPVLPVLGTLPVDSKAGGK